MAAVTVTNVTNANNLVFNTFTTITGPAITEGGGKDIGTGTIILNAPSGFVFNTNATVTVRILKVSNGADDPTKNINDAANGTSLAITSITPTQITFTVTQETDNGVKNSLTWQGIQVTPTVPTPVNGSISKTGTSNVKPFNAASFLLGLLIQPSPADVTAPVITLLGSTPVNVTQNTSYVDAGATASDNLDGNITANIVTVNPVNTAVVGPYTVTYNVNDSAGNPATQITRTVNVVAAPDTTPPVISGMPTDDAVAATSPAGAVYSYVSPTANDAVVGSVPVTCVPAANSTFSVGLTTVNCTATDGINSVTESFNVTVTPFVPGNVAPTADAGADKNIGEGFLGFNGLGSSDSDGLIVNYYWDFGDGGNASSNISEMTHTYVDNGTYTVTLTVTDDDGATDSDTLTATITNADPTADPAADQFGAEGAPKIFDLASYNDAGSADTHTATIDWDDGSPLEIISVSGLIVYANHTFADNATYLVSVIVTDDDGGNDTATTIVTIANVDPVVTAGSDQSGDEGNLTLVNATFTDDGSADTHANLLTTINWGDGSVTVGSVSGNSVTGSHIYEDNATYAVIITVTDDDGGAGSATLTAFIENAAPTVIAAGDQAVEVSQVLSLDVASFGDDGVLDTHTADIDWGDGTIDSGVITYGVLNSVAGNHTYAAESTYNVIVTVTDDDGDSGSDSFDVTVTAAPEPEPEPEGGGGGGSGDTPPTGGDATTPNEPFVNDLSGLGSFFTVLATGIEGFQGPQSGSGSTGTTETQLEGVVPEQNVPGNAITGAVVGAPEDGNGSLWGLVALVLAILAGIAFVYRRN